MVNKKISIIREESRSESELDYDADDTLYTYAEKLAKEATPSFELLPPSFRDDLVKVLRARYKEAAVDAITTGFNLCFRSKYQASEN